MPQHPFILSPHPAGRRPSAHQAFRNGAAVTDGQSRLDNSGVLRDSRKLPAGPKAGPDKARAKLELLFRD